MTEISNTRSGASLPLSFLTAVSFAFTASACGDDTDPSPDPTGGRAGASQGGRGGAAQGGRGGAAQGGRGGAAQGGSAGATQAGSAGTAQTQLGGAAGTLGRGGSGGVLATGGTTNPIVGGAAGNADSIQVGGTAGGGAGGLPAAGGAAGTTMGGAAGAAALAGGAGVFLGGNGGLGGIAGTAGTAGAAGMAGSGTDIAVFRPEERPFSATLAAGLQVPSGFSIDVFATSVGHARMLATHGGHVYVTRPRQGDVLRLTDSDADGEADERASATTGLPNVHGIAFNASTVYLATPTRVYRGTVTTSGTFESLAPIIEDLPDGGQHPYRTLGIGPDSRLYISIGSSCDACPETNVEHATILQAGLDGAGRSIFARGLRNTIGFGWHPTTDDFWGFDHGSDWRGNDLPPEELNRIESGNNYGWPYCYGPGTPDPIIEDPPNTTKAAYCVGTESPVLGFQAHSAPIGMVFYTGVQFPTEFDGDAFVALRGSWNRFPPTGYKVSRLRFQAGEPVELQDFVTGFLIEGGNAIFGRPAGIAVASDGALLFSDDTNGVVYRVSYEAP